MAILLSSTALILMVMPLISLCCVIKSKKQFLHFREFLQTCSIFSYKTECSSATLGHLLGNNLSNLIFISHVNNVFDLKYSRTENVSIR